MNPIYYLKNARLSFAEKILFSQLNLMIYPHDRICLIGRNGCGKSSLLKIIQGDYTLDEGEIYLAPTAKIGYLAQNLKVDLTQNIYKFIFADMPDEIETYRYKADIFLTQLKIDGNLLLADLSGGQLRRATLAKVLVEEPEILLLDEPTNHLDINSIEWLEEYLKTYQGAVICISHDRAFLDNISNKLWWLDRGTLHKANQGFSYFDTWSEQILSEEASNLVKMGKKLDQENIWLQQGVTGRRKRNQGRLNSLIKLRQNLRIQQQQINNVNHKFNIHDLGDNIKSKFIVEATNLNFGYAESKRLVKDFSIRIMKGEKIGLIGPNGCGKTTLVQLLAGLKQSTTGHVKYGAQLDISYFDQHKVDLQLADNLVENLCPNGGDVISLPNDQTMHVAAYLKSFLFETKQLYTKASTLSGGEASRLMLAKILAKPGNFLILDEPTNDLDMDSLEMLQDILSEYSGTVLIISHDRDFLDKLVSRTLVFTEDNNIIDYIGGYADYKEHFKTQAKIISKPAKTLLAVEKSDNTAKKLSYKYQRRLEILPSLIKNLEQDVKLAEQKLSTDDLYNKDNKQFNMLNQKLEQDKIEIQNLEDEWLQILEMQQNMMK